jgi:hypothetical protein
MFDVYVARDENGRAHIYLKKPKKIGKRWLCDSVLFELELGSFPEIKWEDEEPTKASMVLKSREGWT